MDIIAKLKTGNEHHQAGRLMAAEVVYEEVLQHCPDHPDALHLSGLVAFQQGNRKASVRRIERAVKKKPTHVGYLKNLCAILLVTGPVEKAASYLERTLVLCPDSAQLWFEMGNTRHHQGELVKAVQAYKKSLTLKPDHADGYHNLGTVLYDLKEYDEAVACYDKALELKPEFPEAMYNMGNALREIGAMDKAIGAMHKAICRKPEYHDARFNLAKMYKDTGQTEGAIEAYTDILKSNPESVEAYNNLGNLFYDIGQTEQAHHLYDQALKINPNYPQAHVNMSLALQDMGNLKKAMVYSRQAMDLRPGYAEAVTSLVHQKREACDWDDLDELDILLDELTRKALSEGLRPAEGPFINLSRRAEPAMNLAVAKSWSKDLVSRVQAIDTTYGKTAIALSHHKRSEKKITIGYLSNNFRHHPMAHLLCSVFGLHDRNRFKIHCYSYGRDDGSIYREQIKVESDVFVELANVQDRDAAAIIHGDHVDILVDLTGYMKGHRMGICAQRPAPILVRYLGQAGTTGADFFDYLIADAIAIPAAQQPYYSENLVYLPHCYQINNRQQVVADVSYDRETFGLPSKGFVFCAFSSHYKLDPTMFASWMKILSTVKNSVLWLIPGSDIAEENLKGQAARHGINPDRVVFATRLPKDQHLARLAFADLALDTRIVGGAATTTDALWAGVPVISLVGRHFASRMSASLLNAAGLPELVCDSIQAYEAKAIELAEDRPQWVALREKLSANKMSAPLFQTEQAVRHLESAYAQMWDNHIQGRRPQPFTASECPTRLTPGKQYKERDDTGHSYRDLR